MKKPGSLLGCAVLVATMAACSGSTGTGLGEGEGSSGGSGGGSRNGPAQGTDATDPVNASSRSEQVNGGCPSSPKELTGTKSAGSSCTTFADCAPVCCDCGTGDSYLSAACIDKTCASKATTCAMRSKKTFCGEDTSEPTPPTPTPSTGKVCVDGTYSSCYGAGMNWTGAKCCVDGPTTCVDGSYTSCYGSKMKWTGAKCCVSNATTCTAGTYTSCYGGPMSWTGASCCFDQSVTCVQGTASSCYGTGKYWTGALCCMK